MPSGATFSTMTRLTAASSLERVDVVQAEVVALADVGDDGDVAAVEAEAFAQDAAARGFEHRRVDERDARARCARCAGRCSRRCRCVGRRRRCRRCTSCRRRARAPRTEVRDQPRRGRLAVGAGDGDDRDAAVVAGREHRSTIALADVARLAGRRLQVHAQAGRGVDLDDAAALLLERRGRCPAHDVDAAMSRPTMRAASTARAATSGCTSSVTSVAVPPVLRLALLRRTRVRPRRHRVGRVALLGEHRRARCRRARSLSDVAWPSLRRGSRVTWSTSSLTVCRRRRSHAADRDAPRRPACRPPPAGGSRCPGRTLDQDRRAFLSRCVIGRSTAACSGSMLTATPRPGCRTAA